jgi:hypothetical protein
VKSRLIQMAHRIRSQKTKMSLEVGQRILDTSKSAINRVQTSPLHAITTKVSYGRIASDFGARIVTGTQEVHIENVAHDLVMEPVTDEMDDSQRWVASGDGWVSLEYLKKMQLANVNSTLPVEATTVSQSGRTSPQKMDYFKVCGLAPRPSKTNIVVAHDSTIQLSKDIFPNKTTNQIPKLFKIEIYDQNSTTTRSPPVVPKLRERVNETPLSQSPASQSSTQQVAPYKAAPQAPANSPSRRVISTAVRHSTTSTFDPRKDPEAARESTATLNPLSVEDILGEGSNKTLTSVLLSKKGGKERSLLTSFFRWFNFFRAIISAGLNN